MNELKNFEIKKTSNTPAVYFNKCGILKIAGRSLPEDTITWYDKLKESMRLFIGGNKSIEISIELEYINSSSSKALLEVLRLLVDNGVDMSVIWYYEEDDEDILELGEFYEEDLGIKFTFKEYSSFGF